MPLVARTDSADAEKGDYGKDLVVTGVRDVPDAAAALTANIANVEISPEENKRLLRKIDFNILPLLCCIYLIQFLDKTALSYASIMGIREDNNLSLSQYSWLSSIFYIAYLVGEWPTNYCLQRLPLAKYTGANIVAWGIVLACTAVTHNYAGLVAVRFLLGLFEACITPSFSLVTSQWYRKREQGFRTGIWFSFNAFANVIGAFMAWGFAKHDAAGDLSIPGWKILFIFLGGVTIVLGIAVLLFLPDSPKDARFLDEQDRVLVIERIRANQTGIGTKVHKWYQVREALLDPLTWCYCAFAVAMNIFNGGITAFFSILIASFGFNKLDSLLYNAPGGGLLFVGVLFFLWLGDRVKLRILCGIIPIAIGLLGVLLCWQLPTKYKVGRLIGYYLWLYATIGAISCVSLLSSNVSGSTKKTTVTALFFVAYAVGNLIGPQAFRSQDAPRYNPGLAISTAVIAFGLLDLLVIWYLYRRENKRRDKITSSPDWEPKPNQEFLDLTDRENMAFRYTC
ncbi:membrane transporter [Rhodotorula sp. JG-1b]|nr:membrane transporter [Rhodotorula sp. JG-1b]